MELTQEQLNRIYGLDIESPKYSFTIDNITYTQIAEDKDLYTPDDGETVLSPAKILTTHYPAFYRRDTCRSIEFPLFFYELSLSNKRRIFFLAYYKQFGAETFAKADILIDFFNHYQTARIPKNSIYQEYRSCLFATGNNDYAAASLLLHQGPISRKTFMKASARKIINYQLKLEKEGFTIYLRNPSTSDLEMHIWNALNWAYTQYQNKLIRQIKLSRKDMEDIETNTYRMVYNDGDSWYSFPNNISSQIMGVIQSYMDTLNCAFTAASEMPEPPHVSLEIEPDDWLYEWNDQTVLPFLYTDFSFDTLSTAAMIERNEENNQRSCLLNLWTKYLKLKGNLDPSISYPRSELINYFNDVNLKSGEKYGFFIKPKRGYYQPIFLKEPPPWVTENPEQNTEKGEE